MEVERDSNEMNVWEGQLDTGVGLGRRQSTAHLD